MSVLTKVFVVLLVVVSLLTSAGILVFVNQTQNFNVSLKAAENARLAAEAQNNALKAAASAEVATEAALRKQVDDQAIALSKAGDPYNDKINDLNNKVASLTSDKLIAQVNLTNATNEVTASEAVRAKLSQDLTDARAMIDKLNTNNSDQSIALADLTNKLEVDEAKVREFGEQNAELKAEDMRLAAEIADAGIKVAAGPTGIREGSPRINGVVLSTSTQNGIPNATISVGTDADVKVGMRFYVVDTSKTGQGFLGVLTVDSVDAKEATGRLEGPKIADIKKDVEVKTHLD